MILMMIKMTVHMIAIVIMIMIMIVIMIVIWFWLRLFEFIFFFFQQLLFASWPDDFFLSTSQELRLFTIISKMEMTRKKFKLLTHAEMWVFFMHLVHNHHTTTTQPPHNHHTTTTQPPHRNQSRKMQSGLKHS